MDQQNLFFRFWIEKTKQHKQNLFFRFWIEKTKQHKQNKVLSQCQIWPQYANNFKITAKDPPCSQKVFLPMWNKGQNASKTDISIPMKTRKVNFNSIYPWHANL